MDEREPTSAGWAALDEACARLYGDQVPRHVAYFPGAAFGSVLQGCSAYRAEGHWHYVTYGLSNLFDQDAGVSDGYSGWGYELAWRVRDAAADTAPDWPFMMIQRLAKHAVDTALLLETDTRIELGRSVTGFPVSGGPDTDLHTIVFDLDPELGAITTVNGSVRFLQLVPLDDQHAVVARTRGPAAAVAEIRRSDPLMVTVVT